MTGVGENSTKTKNEAAALYFAFYFAKNYKNVPGSILLFPHAHVIIVQPCHYRV